MNPQGSQKPATPDAPAQSAALQGAFLAFRKTAAAAAAAKAKPSPPGVQPSGDGGALVAASASASRDPGPAGPAPSPSKASTIRVSRQTTAGSIREAAEQPAEAATAAP